MQSNAKCTLCADLDSAMLFVHCHAHPLLHLMMPGLLLHNMDKLDKYIIAL